MAWPQYIMLGLMLVGVGVSIAKFGQEKGVRLSGKRDTYDIIDVLIGPAITFTLLWAGNFWEAGARWP